MLVTLISCDVPLIAAPARPFCVIRLLSIATVPGLAVIVHFQTVATVATQHIVLQADIGDFALGLRFDVDAGLRRRAV